MIGLGVDVAHPRHRRPFFQHPIGSHSRTLFRQCQSFSLKGRDQSLAAQDRHPSVLLHHNRIHGPQQGLQRIADPHWAVDDIAGHLPVHALDDEVVLFQPAAPQDGGDHGRDISGQSSVQPVPGLPGRGVRPHILARRKRRPGPRVPAPGVRRLQHPPFIGRRPGIVPRRHIVRQHRLQRPPLHPVAAPPGGKRRQGALVALGIEEQVRRIAPAVHGRATELRQPDRLHPGQPLCRRRRPHPVDPLVVRVRPPADQILRPEHPVLAMRRIEDGRPRLRRPRLGVGVEPVEPLAARDPARQIQRVSLMRMILRIQTAVSVLPVRQRRIPVDAHVIDGLVRPQRIQMKPHLAVRRLMPEILRPVRRIGQFDIRPDDVPAFRRQRPIGLNRRITALRVAGPGQPAHLRPDQQPVRAAFRCQRRIMPRQTPQAPVFDTSEDRRHLVERVRPILAPDAPAPRIGRLERLLVGEARQFIVRRNVHEDERIQGDLQPARLQRRHRLPHAVVRGGPAIGRRALDPADQMGVRPRQARDAPAGALRHLVPALDTRLHPAMAGPQVVAEPADHQTDPLQIRTLAGQLLQRHQDVRPALAIVDVLGLCPRQPLAPHHHLGRQHELPRAGDQAHAFELLLKPLASGPFQHLETQLRRPVAIRPQRQVLEHHIGHAAIGRRRALHCLDQRIGHLRRRSAIDPHRHAAQVHQPPVGPDPLDRVDLALADRHGEAQRIGGLDRARSALAAAVLVPALQKARRPDHLARHPHPPQHAVHRRALGRGLQPQSLQPRPPLPRRRQ